MAILIAFLNTVIVLTCLFLICLVLIQRGKGGGLAGAFGGVGGSSAFGTKAGDIFTKVTMFVALGWIMLSMLLVVLYNQPRKSAFDDGKAPAVSREVSPKKAKSAVVPGAPKPATDAKTEGSKAATDVPAIPDTPSPKN